LKTIDVPDGTSLQDTFVIGLTLAQQSGEPIGITPPTVRPQYDFEVFPYDTMETARFLKFGLHQRPLFQYSFLPEGREVLEHADEYRTRQIDATHQVLLSIGFNDLQDAAFFRSVFSQLDVLGSSIRMETIQIRALLDALYKSGFTDRRWAGELNYEEPGGMSLERIAAGTMRSLRFRRVIPAWLRDYRFGECEALPT